MDRTRALRIPGTVIVRRLWWTLLLAGTPVLGLVLYGQEPRDPLDHRPARLDSLVRAYAQLEQFAGAVLVADRGRVLYRKGVGLADRELGVPASPEHRFIIGSMTKAFTAVLVLQDVAAGRLALDTPVVRYWPEFPDPSGGLITVRHLLTHRSGLGHWGAVDDFLERVARMPHTPEEIVRRYAEQGLCFPPGSDESYSSPGYVALGVVLERVTGQPYPELMRTRIFEPLAMDGSMVDDGVTIVPGRVRPYRYNFLRARYDNAEYRDPSTTGATGGILTSVDDLLRWDQALYTDRLLPNTLRALLTDTDLGTAAFGWRVKDHPGVGTVAWHGGLVTGYRSQITRVPENRWTVILLSNLRDASLESLSDAILDVLAGGELRLPKKSLMKEVLRVSAEHGSEAAIARFDDILERETDVYETSPTQLLIAAIELRSDDACDRAAPLYEHWLATYADSPYVVYALRHAADCRLRLSQPMLASALVERLAALDPQDPALAELRQRLK